MWTILMKDGEAERYLLAQSTSVNLSSMGHILDVPRATLTDARSVLSVMNHGDWEPYELPATSTQDKELVKLLGQAGFTLADLEDGSGGEPSPHGDAA